jgi:nucleoside-diphosphate-sugar epimerase
MKILVTGGSGFIGSRLALDARALGHEIVVAGQLNSEPERARCKELAQAGISLQQGPLQDAEYAGRICAGCQLVVHLAAAQHEANVPDDYFFDVNVNGTRTLIEASRRAGVERFVYGSTIGVYGEYAGVPLDENTPPRPLNVYGRSKLAAEEVVKASRAALPTSIVRISETYGPGDFRLLKLFRALDRGRFLIIGSGQNQRQAIHVRDLVHGLLLAATHPAAVGETFVLAGEETMTTREMVEHVARALGRTAPRWHVPLWPFLTAAVAMEKTLSPLGVQPPLHRRRLDFFRKSFVFSTAKAQRVLGFTASVPFAAGTVETANWYREQGYLGGQAPAGPRGEPA